MTSATSLGTLVIELTGDSMRYRAMWREAESLSSTACANLSRMATTMATTVVASLLAISAAAVSEFAKFDEAMTESLAIMEDISAGTRKEMEATARSIALSTRASATQAAQAYLFLASAGWNAAQSMKALPAVAKFASAANVDMAKATDLLTNSQTALGLASKDAEENLMNLTRVSDVLVHAANISNASSEDLATSLRTKVAASARLLGKDVEEVVAILGAYADQGIKAEYAGEQLSQMMRDTQNAAIEQKDVWRDYGLAVFDAQGKVRPLVDIITDLEKATASYTDKQKTMLFTQLGFQDRSVAAIKALLGTSDKIREYERELRSAGGATDEVSKKQLSSFIAQLTITRNRLNDVFLTIGQELMPMMQDFNKLIGDSAEAQTGFNEKAQELAAFISGAFTGAIGIAMNIFYGWNMIMKVGQSIMVSLAGAFTYGSKAIQTGVLAAGAIVEGVFRGWQKLGNVTFFAIKKSFSEFIIWAREKQIAAAEAMNKILPEANQYKASWFAPLRAEIIQLSADLTKLEKDRENAMADTANVNGAAYEKSMADFKAFHAAVAAETDEFSEANKAIWKEIWQMAADGAPYDILAGKMREAKKAVAEVVPEMSEVEKAWWAIHNATKANVAAVAQVQQAYQRLSPEVQELLKSIAYPWEEGLKKLKEYNKMLADGALTQAEYARARQALDLKGSAQDPLEQAIFKVMELDKQMENGIISAAEYNNAIINAMTSASPFLGQDMLKGKQDGKVDVTGIGQTGIGGVDQFAEIQREQSMQDRLYEIQRASMEKSLSLTKLTEKQRLDILKQMEQSHKLQLMNFQAAKNSLIMQSAESIATDLTSIAKDLAGEQSGIYKTMFAVSKAFAIADAIIKIQQGIANAAALPFPANIPAMAGVAAATASIVSNIQSVKMASFLGGGDVKDGPRAGGVDGMGGKYAVLHPGEKVIDPKNGGSTENLTVNVHNHAGADVTVERSPDGKSLEINIAKRVKREIAGDIRAGGSEVSSAIEQAYKLRR